MDIIKLNGLLILILAFLVVIQNWLIVNASRLLKGEAELTMLEAFNETIFTLQPFLIYPRLKKVQNKKVNLYYFYNNIVVVVVYSLLLSIIVNIIYYEPQ